MSDTVLIVGGIAVSWLVGAVAVIAIWGDPERRFPLLDDGGGAPPTGVVAALWPLALSVVLLWLPCEVAARAGMALNRRLAARRERRRVPRAIAKETKP